MQRLKTNKEAVDLFILNFLPHHSDVEEIQTLYDMMREYPSRPGKGLRSSLCILTCEAFGGDVKKVLQTAAALEIFQNWILIHDDIEDYSEMRRGEPVLHRKYGVPLAINTGDALHGKMWQLLMENRSVLGQQTTMEVIAEFLRMINETTEGQQVELSWVDRNRWNLAEDDYYLLCNKKTAWYTCVCPCRLGAIIAGVDQEKIDTLIPFGSSLGIAFQIQDDILNLKGNEQKYGKERGGDILEGKRTLMLIHLLNKAEGSDRRQVLEIMGRSRDERAQSDVGAILNMMEKYGSIKYAELKAKEYADEAKRLFDDIFRDVQVSQPRLLLADLISFMIRREW
jgi:geranylgeranyl diphosphate synthase type II